jgi:nitroimidazol reductase NimA-like FMN-containing flavoprotein (pyridoxamine 5'-phosphate oxidase superfamily)
MAIREMSREECLRVLARARLARLACARDNQPYVVPVYLAYHEPPGEAFLYGLTTPGLKVEWMRANPLVCVEVDEIAAHDQWVSVVAFGRYEEFSGGDPDKGRAPEQEDVCVDEQVRAWQVLKTDPVWWQPASAAWSARACGDADRPYVPLYYRVRIDRVTGHEATRDARDALSYALTDPPVGRPGWLRRALTRVFGSRSKGAGSAS